MLLAVAVPGQASLVAASLLAVQRLYGPLRNPPSIDGKEKVYGSIP
jgi:hypothetical protein